MKKLLFIAAGTLLLASCNSSDGEVKINLPEDYTENTIVVSHVMLDNMFSATRADDIILHYDTLEVKGHVAKMKLDPEGAARYSIEPPVMTREQPEFYASPGETLSIDIKSFEPLEYTAKGSRLMEDLTAFYAATRPIQMEYFEMASGEDDNITATYAKGLWDRYDEAIKQFVAANPDSPVVPYAILDLSGDDFKEIYDSMTPEARKSILMPFAELNNREVELMLSERAAEDERKAEVASGTIPAPGFTLPDLKGKDVSLSDFRGKWVVLDFWGSWCGWCIKGFPALKEAYRKYGDRLVVIGIDCNEPEADWRAGVKKHDLPWINLYNGLNKSLYEDYQISGFPTKAIINPEGMLVDLTTGEDPSFFTRLAAFME